jgi:dienelactone hydrolase
MRRRIPVFFVVALALLVPNFARANDPIYPVTSFTDSFNGPISSLQDPAGGTYSLEAGFIDGVNRILSQAQAHSGDDPAAQIQALFDSLTHIRPDPPYTHLTDAGDPKYSPDWNHDGVFGDTAEAAPSKVGDFDVDVDSVHDTAYFRYPCLSQKYAWSLRYANASGTCATPTKHPGLGIVHEVSVVDSRGLTLDGTLWIPSAAFKPGACPTFNGSGYASRARWNSCVRPSSFSGKRFPGVVFNDGLASIQQHYYWMAELLVAHGYIVLTYDPAGQGRSEGGAVDLLGLTLPKRPICQLAGSCIDVEDITRWFTGRTITRIADNGSRFAPRKDPSKNAPNPVLPVLDTSRIGMTGHSMGAIATLSYTRAVGEGKGYDGRPVPRIRAASPLMGAFPTLASVPTQFVTADYDGSPTTVVPGLLGVELNGQGEGIGPHAIKKLYDQLRATKGRAPLSLIIIEGGSHEDVADQPPILQTPWSLGLAGWYTTAWFDCWVKGQASACTRAHTALPHLSKAFASEFDADGPIGPLPSRCIVVPTEASLNMTPQEFASAESGKPVYNCRP